MDRDIDMDMEIDVRICSVTVLCAKAFINAQKKDNHFGADVSTHLSGYIWINYKNSPT